MEGKNSKKKKVFEERVQVQKLGAWSKKENYNDSPESLRAKNEVMDESIDDSEKSDGCEERRIVKLKYLGSQLWCCFCEETLSLEYSEKEIRRGLGSVLTIRCHKCLILNTVNTGKQHSDERRKNTERFDIISKTLMGKYL